MICIALVEELLREHRKESSVLTKRIYYVGWSLLVRITIRVILSVFMKCNQRKRILYLSKNMSVYKSASYQQDVIEELSRQANVYCYGPGYPEYSAQDSIVDIVARLSERPDCIVLGHSWLSDRDGQEVDPHGRLNLRKINVMKVAILNKEYVNLNQKLQFIKKNGFDLAFSHHHDVDAYLKQTGVRFYFLPFGFNQRNFDYKGEIKDIDLMFSGLLQNQNRCSKQSDIRVRIMDELFYYRGDLPVEKKPRYINKHILWNAIPRKGTRFNMLSYKINSLVKPKYRYRHIPMTKYATYLSRAKIVINAPSPLGLISPRYFETMASRALVLSEESKHAELLLGKDSFVTFASDLRDFRQKLEICFNEEQYRQEISNNGYKHVMVHHTWEKRVQTMLDLIFT